MRERNAGLGEWLLQLLFPARCLFCGALVPPEENHPLRNVCEACEKERLQTPLLRRYSLPGAGEAGFSVFSAAAYEGGFRKTLYRFKFRGEKSLSKPLGKLLAETARQTGQSFDGVAWVPMTKAKKRKRGYDQSELLAREAAKTLGLPCLPLLEKRKETETQHQLPRRQRLSNVKNSYEARPEARGKALLLVDDIVTTGATLRECAKALYEAGAARVTGLCAADCAAVRTEGEGSP